MRLAFFLVIALVCVGVARGDFASGEARSDESALIEADMIVARGDTTDTPLAPEADRASRGIADALANTFSDLVSRYRAWHEAPATHDSPEVRARAEWTPR